MSEHFADRLLSAIDAKGAPICVGIDPILEMMPEDVAGEAEQRNANDAQASVDAIYEFTTGVLEVVAPHVPCVKFQSAYFEQFLSEGVEAYYSLMHEAAEMGLVVIGDVKRGDIGSTSAAYAAGHLAQLQGPEREELTTPDAITVNPFCGLETLQPFIETARGFGKGLFVLVRTSNPGSAQLQDVPLVDGRTWSEMLADGLAPLAAAEGMIGASGWSLLGAVVGATQPQTMRSIRQRLPKSLFLLPGYGAQGATAEMTRAAFDERGRGAIISASRSILYAHREAKYRSESGDDWRNCVEQAVLDMKEDVRRMLEPG